MFGGGSYSELRRWIGDFVLALALFWAVAASVSGSNPPAYAVTLPRIGTVASASGALAPGEPSLDAGRPVLVSSSSLGHLQVNQSYPDRQQALVLLSLAFAAITALNLAFWRHLRRVYASPRRSVWRRG
jgi:hypothetical protein